MQVPTIDVATFVAVPTGGGVTARVVSGNLAQVPVGALLEATVQSVSPREIALTVNGLPLTVRPPVGIPPFQPGSTLLVRVPPSAANATVPTIELALPAPANPAPAPNATPGTTPRLSEGATRAASAETAPVATRAAPAPSRPAPQTAPPLPPPRLAVVDVLEQLPDGRVRAQIDGVEQIATASEPLAPGGRYALQVQRNPAGIKLSPPAESPALPSDVAAAVLRTPAPTLPAALKPLQAELAALAAPPTKGTASQAPTAVREAAAAVENTLRTFLPSTPHPPDATQLRQLVENGGLHFEAKLARLVAGPDAPGAPNTAPTPTNAKTEPAASTAKAALGPGLANIVSAAKLPNVPNSANPATAKLTDAPQAAKSEPAPRDPNPVGAQTSDRAATPTARDLGPDLKGDLLRLLQAVNDLGGASRAPAAEAAVRGIESQQAANVLAQTNNTPYFLQVPFPDGGEWRTLHLSLEPQHRPDQTADTEQAGRFRVFMHVPLTDLGETWIDAGLAGDKFRATIYLDRSAVRDRVRSALPELRRELEGDGFAEVLLDVRSSNELPERHRRESSAMLAGRPDTVSVLDVRA